MANEVITKGSRRRKPIDPKIFNYFRGIKKAIESMPGDAVLAMVDRKTLESLPADKYVIIKE